MFLDCSRSPICPCNCKAGRGSEFEGPPCWFLRRAKSGEITKCPWVGALGVNSGGVCM